MSNVTIDLEIKEIKNIMCKKCKEKLRKLVNEKVLEQLAGQLTDKILEET